MMAKYALTKHLPTYDRAQSFLEIVVGGSFQTYREMHIAIMSQLGTPQSTMNWKQPEEWIPERLEGSHRALALRIWRESHGLVNPRYTDGIWSLCTEHNLVTWPDDELSLTDAGRRFLCNDDATLAKIDAREGILQILSSVSELGPGQRRDFLANHRQFCLANTTWRAENLVYETLGLRLKNLVQRELISKTGGLYQITEAGIAYLGGGNRVVKAWTEPDESVARPPQNEEPKDVLLSLIQHNNKSIRGQFVERLRVMNPYAFEHLIKHLLEKMGYDDVEVTAASNDKGVDVVGDIELGISRVREVIQVKRQQSNVGRGVLDSLRGSIHRFEAVRATIITTSGFTKGAQDAAFEKGVAPITLIDGESLLDLLVEHEIGVRKGNIRFLEFDEPSLSQFESENDVEFPS